MSAVLTAARPRGRRSLERSGMTPEEELELLIAEQQADDVYTISPPHGQVSLDAAAPDGKGIVADLIGVTEDGEIVSFFRPVSLLADVTQTPHGYGGYTKYGCRCLKCRKANADYRREYRARRRADS